MYVFLRFFSFLVLFAISLVFTAHWFLAGVPFGGVMCAHEPNALIAAVESVMFVAALALSLLLLRAMLKQRLPNG